MAGAVFFVCFLILGVQSIENLGSPATLPIDPLVVGCSDGTREGFIAKGEGNTFFYPNIAGCKGAWTVPGVSVHTPIVAPACPNLHPTNTLQPHCNRQAGNTGKIKAGTGCAASDICAVGWHICTDYQDVNLNSNGAGCTPCGTGVSGDYLFLSRQSSNGCGLCSLGSITDPLKCNSKACQPNCLQTERISNDVFGCGNYGPKVEGGFSCSPFNRFSHDKCTQINAWGWSCSPPTDPEGICETYTVTHSNYNNGGVLCCKDANCPDADGDKVSDCFDNCISIANPDQKDCDKDGTGTACDPCPYNPQIDNSNYDPKVGCGKSYLQRRARSPQHALEQ
eukprot:TRINITY_DN78_c0_g1_i4.p1 TRINITY_DN78_c0_g1~~TRINITY_DN78_c0_g1_i4.p1  ORF type:complete len:337 (+),score=17.25 TRINITY_DN78_c0_g1_i4:113-1123(+)